MNEKNNNKNKNELQKPTTVRDQILRNPNDRIEMRIQRVQELHKRTYALLYVHMGIKGVCVYDINI
jgi:hypothetical protein